MKKKLGITINRKTQDFSNKRVLSFEGRSFIENVCSFSLFIGVYSCNNKVYLLQNEILDMIFTVAIEGFEEDRISWLQLAADVFEELAVMPSLEPVFRE